MPHSPNLVSQAAERPSQPPATPPQTHAVPWLRRIDLFVRVMIRLYLGLILIFLPWTHLWTLNRFFLYYAPLAHLTANGAVRGLVSGLGILNLWIAISEAIQYREH